MCRARQVGLNLSLSTAWGILLEFLNWIIFYKLACTLNNFENHRTKQVDPRVHSRGWPRGHGGGTGGQLRLLTLQTLQTSPVLPASQTLHTTQVTNVTDAREPADLEDLHLLFHRLVHVVLPARFLPHPLWAPNRRLAAGEPPAADGYFGY